MGRIKQLDGLLLFFFWGEGGVLTSLIRVIAALFLCGALTQAIHSPFLYFLLLIFNDSGN